MIITSLDSLAIVVASEATPRELFAAEELKAYLQKLIGVNASIVEAEYCFSAKQFIIGGPKRNAAARELIDAREFASLFSGDEGFLLRSFGENTILIAGTEDSCERGTVYGVYEFLERFCGCSLSAYTNPHLAAGEWVPHQDALSLTSVDYIKPQADRAFRCACVQYGDCAGNADMMLNDSFFRWLIKNRYNYVYTWTKVYEKLKDTGSLYNAARYGLEFIAGHHDVLDLFLPANGNRYFPEKYYETHPEYFRLQEEGTRFYPVDHWGQIILCCRNQDLIEEISNNIITWLAQNPSVRMIQIAPHDGRAPQCTCEKCSPYGKAENFTYFTNEITKRVCAVYPNVKIIQMVYSDLWECPENMRLSPNLMILEATWHGYLRKFGKPDGSGLIGTDFDDNIKRWQKTGARTLFYDYYMGVYQGRQRYIPMADEIQAIWKYFVQQDIDGASTQIECFNHWNHLFNFYTFGRTAYDTDLSLADNLERFSKIFGEGAPFVKKAILLAEECLDGQSDIKLGGLFFIENIDWNTIYSLYNQALDAAETSLARNNLRLMRMALRYSDLESQQQNAKYIQPGPEFQPVRPFAEIDPELLYMTRFDSYWKNDPGYGIDIPVKEDGTVSARPFAPENDRWYCFE